MRRQFGMTAAAACALVLICAASAAAAPKLDGTFAVSSLEANNKIVAGPDGSVWLTLSGAAKDLARITPGGQVKEFELGIEKPEGIAAGPEGNLWIAFNGGVAKFSPSDPEGTKVATPIPAVKAGASLVAGPDGNIWVATEENVIDFPPSKPLEFKTLAIPKLSPHDIDVAGSLLVIADAGNSRIVTLSTAGSEHDYPLAGTEATSQGVAGSPSGQIGYAQSTTPEGVGLITPPGPPKEIEMAGDPFGATLGSDGAFWIALSAKDGVERLTPEGQTSFLGGFPPKFFPRQITSGPNNTLWVTMEIPGEEVFEVARISGLEPPLTPGPTPIPPKAILKGVTTISKGPAKKVKISGKRAKVTFRFSSTLGAASFECALAKVKKGKKTAQLAFKPCKSPKTFKVGPGSYRFSVRAVSAGVPESSLASRAFRVVRPT